MGKIKDLKSGNDNTRYFEYYNNNPKNKRTGDCVIRALALALNKDYIDVYKELFEMSLKTGYFMASIEIIRKYLKANNMIEFKQPIIFKNGSRKKIKIKEFLDKLDELAILPSNIVVSTRKHILTLHYCKVFDIWNSSLEIMGNFWINKDEYYTILDKDLDNALYNSKLFNIKN